MKGRKILYFRRKEAFRYKFDTPIPCKIKIDEINGTKLNNLYVSKGEVIDLSPNGMKIKLPLKMNVSETSIAISVLFTLNEAEYQVQGQMRWMIENDLSSTFYGIQCFNSYELKEGLIKELKKYAKQKVGIVERNSVGIFINNRSQFLLENRFLSKKREDN